MISEQTVEDVKHSGYDYIFTKFNVNDDSDKTVVKPEFVEIKSEVVNVDYEMDTDSTEEESNVSIETPIDPADSVEEIKSEISSVDDDDTSIISNNTLTDNDFVKTSGISTTDTEIPSTCEDASVSDTTCFSSGPLAATAVAGITPVSLMISGVPNTVLPASGFMSDLTSQNTLSVSQMIRTRRNNVSYTSDATQGVPKSGYLEDWVAEINSATQQNITERTFKGDKKVGYGKKVIKVTDGKKKEKTRSKKYSHQPGLSVCPDCHEKFTSCKYSFCYDV